MDKVMSFPVACKKFFGLKEGETVGQFVGEIKSLTDEDRMEMAALIAVELGNEVTPFVTNK